MLNMMEPESTSQNWTDHAPPRRHRQPAATPSRSRIERAPVPPALWRIAPGDPGRAAWPRHPHAGQPRFCRGIAGLAQHRAGAYEQLLSEGYLEMRPGSGTYVAADLPDLPPE